MRSILIAGGDAPLGAAFATSWLERGWQAVVLDRDDLLPGGDAKAAAGLKIVRGALRDRDFVRALVQAADVVLHLAALLGAERYPSGAEGVLDADLAGTRTVLQACAAAGRPVILGSSSDIYGRTAGILAEESVCVLGPSFNFRWTRALACLAAEECAAALGRDGLRFLVARYFNLYGPPLDRPGPGRVINRFLECIRSGQPLRVVDGGGAIRSFCFIDDAVEATVLFGKALLESDSFVGRTFNIGRDEPISIAQLAGRMVHLSEHAAGLVSNPGELTGRAGFEEIPYCVPDLTAMQAAIGFEAKTSLSEGLRETLAHWGLLASDDSGEALRTPAVGIERIPWVRPIFEADEVLADIRVALSTGRVTNNGPYLVDFERRLAHYLGVDGCVVVSSGSAAMIVAMLALGIESGKAVLPSFTYIATLNAVVQCGLTPVFCDIDPDTWTLSPTHLEQLLAADPEIKLVVPVNSYGVPPDLAAIRRITEGRGALVMLDNAHGLGTEQNGVRCPPEPIAQAYSLHATKNLPAVEGGAIVSTDPRLFAEIVRLRNHGLAGDLLSSAPGYNAKMSELHAAVGLRSLRDLDAAIERRREYVTRLRRVLAEECAARFQVQTIPDAVRSNMQNLAVVCRLGEGEDVTAVQGELEVEGIETRRYFWPALHDLPAYRGRFSLPVTDVVAGGVICLPLHSRMEPRVLDRIAAALRKVSSRFA